MVDIQVTLTTPANAAGPVPVVMQFGFAGGFGAGPGAAPGASAAAAGRGMAFPGRAAAQRAHLAAAGSGQGLGLCQPQSRQHPGRQRRGPDARHHRPGATRAKPRKLDDWGALRAWAWGASRALDYFETDKSVDARHVGLEGHSR